MGASLVLLVAPTVMVSAAEDCADASEIEAASASEMGICKTLTPPDFSSIKSPHSFARQRAASPLMSPRACRSLRHRPHHHAVNAFVRNGLIVVIRSATHPFNTVRPGCSRSHDKRRNQD